MKDHPGICSLQDCNKPLGVNHMTFTHKGKLCGSICEACLNNSAKLRIILEANKEGILQPTELVQLDNKLS